MKMGQKGKNGRCSRGKLLARGPFARGCRYSLCTHRPSPGRISITRNPSFSPHPPSSPPPALPSSPVLHLHHPQPCLHPHRSKCCACHRLPHPREAREMERSSGNRRAEDQEENDQRRDVGERWQPRHPGDGKQIFGLIALSGSGAGRFPL